MTRYDACACFEDQIGAYVAGTLDTPTSEELRRHLATCDRCATAQRETRTLADAVRDLQIPSPALTFENSLAAILDRTTSQEREPVSRARSPLVGVAADITPQPSQSEPHPPTPFPRREGGARSGRRGSQRRAGAPEPHRRNALRTLGGLAAVLALIVAAATIFSSFAVGGNRRPSAGNSTPPVSQNQGAHTTWETVTQLPTTRGVISVAPSDPRVLYSLQADVATLSRSTDDGKTWSDRTLPANHPAASATGSTLSIGVDPADANVLYLTMVGGSSCGRPSAIGAKIARSGNPISGCEVQDVSTDGGMSWQPESLPAAGALDVIAAQGALRYAQLFTGPIGAPPTSQRLITSGDGVTWTYADSPLYARGLQVYEFVVTPTGATILAKAAPPTTSANGATDPARTDLWRSDDAGKTWSDLGQFPDLTTPGLTDTHLLAAVNLGGKTMVYRLISVEGTAKRPGGEAVYVSVDGGVSWQPAAFKGIPANMRLAFPATMPLAPAPLADGSVALSFSVWDGAESHRETLAYFSWRPGASSWTRLTPDIQIYNDQPGWLAPAHDGQPDTIWLRVITGFTQTGPNEFRGAGEDLLRCALE